MNGQQPINISRLSGLAALGCSTCPCSSTCGGKPAAAGLAGLAACNCVGCPKAPTCPKARQKQAAALGFTFEAPTLDFTDWKTWMLAALAATLLYNLFFRSEQREKRSARRADMRAENDRHAAALRRIKEAR